MPTDTTVPLDRSKPDEPQPPYSEALRQLLTDIADCEKQRVAAEATINSLSTKLTKKERLISRDLGVLTQLTEAHTTSQQAKKEIEKHLKSVQLLTVDPLRQVLQHVPLSLNVNGYEFTIRANPNSVNAWMLDLTVAYQPA